MNEIGRITVGKLIRNEDTPERTPKVEHYLVPDYQRGYRWDTDNVQALLNDIDSFMQSIEKTSDFYCLQPIVVYKNKDLENKTIWEVIDGQQRLTTIYLMLKCLRSWDVFELSYKKREKSGEFLKQLCENGIENHDNPDFHYMSQAYSVIKGWLIKKNDKDSGYADKFSNILKNQVQVIWYKIDCKSEEEKIDIFNRLNIGKIPLTDAELVKALILSKICINLSEREKNIRQAELAGEWDAIERELQKPDKWNFLNPSKLYSSHIEFIFDLIAKPDEKKYSTYLFFEKTIQEGIDYSKGDKKEHENKEKENAKELWAKIKEYFTRINSWFCESSNKKPIIYHYIGYIFARKLASCSEILELSEQDKDIFENSLKMMIKEDIKKINLQEINYEENSGDISKILLLFNVLSCLRISDGQNNRFPFNRYNASIKESNVWSLEHIHAQQSDDAMTNEKSIISWIDDTYKSIESILSVKKDSSEIKTDELKKKLLSLRERLIIKVNKKEKFSDTDLEAFHILRNDITDVFDSKTKHEISNLALLTRNDNAALSNDIFPVKRNKIIQMEKDGKFIPPCTRNVFLKFYSDSNSQPYYWSAEDKNAYFKEIESVINGFLEK